jgi:hypothetical protein
MHEPRDGYNYIESSEHNGLGFVIESNENEYIFWWQTTNGKTLLDSKLPEIQKIYSTAQTLDGIKNSEWKRVFIPVNQNKPLVDSLEIIRKTESIVGYGK